MALTTWLPRSLRQTVRLVVHSAEASMHYSDLAPIERKEIRNIYKTCFNALSVFLSVNSLAVS